MAQWWYYSGRVTTAIDLPGREGFVLKPRSRFEAPMSAVAHLLRKKMVIPVKPPIQKEGPADKPAPKSEKRTDDGTAPGAAHVVASESTEADELAEAPGVPMESDAEVVEGEDDSSTEASEEEPQKSDGASEDAPVPMTRKRRRRGRS